MLTTQLRNRVASRVLLFWFSSEINVLAPASHDNRKQLDCVPILHISRVSSLQFEFAARLNHYNYRNIFGNPQLVSINLSQGARSASFCHLKVVRNVACSFLYNIRLEEHAAIKWFTHNMWSQFPTSKSPFYSPWWNDSEIKTKSINLNSSIEIELFW